MDIKLTSSTDKCLHTLLWNSFFCVSPSDSSGLIPYEVYMRTSNIDGEDCIDVEDVTVVNMRTGRISYCNRELLVTKLKQVEELELIEDI